MLVPGQAHVGRRDRVEGGVLVDVPVGDLVDRPQGRGVLAGHESHPSLRRSGVTGFSQRGRALDRQPPPPAARGARTAGGGPPPWGGGRFAGALRAAGSPCRTATRAATSSSEASPR